MSPRLSTIKSSPRSTYELRAAGASDVRASPIVMVLSRSDLDWLLEIGGLKTVKIWELVKIAAHAANDSTCQWYSVIRPVNQDVVPWSR